MTVVQKHYDDHLGPIYAWYTGAFDEASRASRSLFDELGAKPGETGVAVDLGSGHGLQSIPLAERGFEVVAVDTCAELLRSLEERRGALPIRTLHADITECWHALPRRVDLAICMGDTLTHLPSRDAVTALLDHVARALVPGGAFVATFRDYVSDPLEREARFIPVRSDADRILTCFLEYGDEHVRVHDIVHERSESGWSLRVSAYDKLRLDPRWVVERMRESGFAIGLDRCERGMVTITGSSGGTTRT